MFIRLYLEFIKYFIYKFIVKCIVISSIAIPFNLIIEGTYSITQNSTGYHLLFLSIYEFYGKLQPHIY